MPLVVDASALVDMILGVDAAGAIRQRVFSDAVHFPVTIDAETLHALRRQWISGQVSQYRADLALGFLQTIRATRHPVTPLVHRMWELRQNITAYDAAYVALAERLNVPLITRDARLARSSGHSARIEYIA